MKAVFQRVASAEVRSEGRVTGRIGPGAVILLGVGRADTAADAEKLADKVAKHTLSRSQRLRFYLRYSGRRGLAAADRRHIARVLRFFEGRE